MLGVILILALGLGWACHSFVWGAFGAVLILLSLEGFFLPTRYEISERAISVRRTFSRSEREWGTIRRVYEDAHGVTLSPFAGRHVLEPYRAIRVLFDGGDAPAIRSRLREALGAGRDSGGAVGAAGAEDVAWIGPQRRRDEA